MISISPVFIHLFTIFFVSSLCQGMEHTDVCSISILSLPPEIRFSIPQYMLDPHAAKESIQALVSYNNTCRILRSDMHELTRYSANTIHDEFQLLTLKKDLNEFEKEFAEFISLIPKSMHHEVLYMLERASRISFLHNIIITTKTKLLPADPLSEELLGRTFPNFYCSTYDKIADSTSSDLDDSSPIEATSPINFYLSPSFKQHRRTQSNI